jgi:DNA-binding SARP family transcriptional activator
MAFTFRVLGTIEVGNGDRAVLVPAGKLRSLLVALLLNANRLVPMEALVDALWDATPPRSAVANVRTYAVALRRLLADPALPDRSRLLSQEGTYRLMVEPGELDLADFTRLAAGGRAALRGGDPARAVTTLMAALALWREASAGLGVPRLGALGRWLTAVDEERLGTAEDLAEARLLRGEHAAVLGELRRTTAQHPMRERSWAQLMRALYQAGDVAGALRCYQDARHGLRDTIGVDPGPDLCQLHAAILARDPELGVRQAQPSAAGRTTAPGGAAGGPPRELPPDPGSLSGRAGAVERARRAAETGAGVLNVYGPPGAGGSALGVHLAHLLSARFPDGQLYLRLDSGDPSGAAGQLLQALGVTEADWPDGLAARGARLRSMLAGRRVLLLLDDARTAEQVRPLLPAGPRCLTVVVSARPLTTLDGVAPVPVPPLAEADGIELLHRWTGPERLGAAARDLVRLCAGLPLALRVVAARLAGRPDLPAADLVARLGPEHRRLDLLRAGDLSVRASLAARCALLSAPARDLLRRLADRRPYGTPDPDRRPYRRRDADRVADALDELAEVQLLAGDGRGGYRLPPLTRLYARELGGPAGTVPGSAGRQVDVSRLARACIPVA